MYEPANPTARRTCAATGCGEPAVVGTLDAFQYVDRADEALDRCLDGFCVRHRGAFMKEGWIVDVLSRLYGGDAFDRDRRRLE